jgi:putative ABC transport system permease protein
MMAGSGAAIVARALVACASRLAPRASRREFLAEWEAEVAWAAGEIAGRRGAVGHLHRELMARAAGAIRHALWLRKEQWSLDMLWQDVKYAARVLLARPSFTLVAALTLALGIGANTAIFSTVYGVLLKPLPFSDPDRLVQIWETNPLRNWTGATASPANLLDWRKRNRVFDGIAFYPGMEDRTPMYMNSTFTAPGAEPERLQAVQVSTNFFKVLGVAPVHGRDFAPHEEISGQHRVAILSDALWRAQFNGERAVVGRDITLNGRPYHVIGVMPPTFRFPAPDVQLWVPFVMQQGIEQVRRPHFLRPIARLKAGVAVEQARRDLQRIAAELEREYPDTNTKMGADLGPLHEWIVGDVRRSLLVFLGAVALVLLVACANLANLLLARAAGRRRELAIRSALGGAGWRIARQLLTESAVLAILGGVLGVFVARWSIDLILSLSPAGVPRLAEVALDARMLGFVALLTSVTALLFGLAPAIHGARPDAAWLRDGTRTTGGADRTRRVLVVAQIAVSVALVVSAGLLLRSFVRLQAVPPGFDPAHALSFRVTLPAATYDTDDKAIRFFDELTGRLRAMPSVRAAGGSTKIGLDGQGWTGDLFIDGRSDVWGRELRHKEVTPGYFAAMGLPLVRGRDFNDADRPDSRPVAVVNEALVRSYFKDADPIGQRIAFSRRRPGQPPPTWWTIVGVVRDEKQNGLDERVAPEVYETHRQNATSGMTLVVRSELPATQLVPSIRRELRALDPGIAMFEMRTLRDVVHESVARERFATWIVGLFAALALVIAAIGVYGVISYSVSRRTQEIGVRVALGATRREVMGLVFRETFGLVVAGLVTGLLLSIAAGRSLQALLFETAPTDVLTYAAVVGVIALVGLLASYVPARRALGVDPIAALRAE